MPTNIIGAAECEAMGAVAAVGADAHYVLRLYITGTTSQSTRAILNIRKICEKHLEGRYELKVVDISQHPSLAIGEQIIAAPTLIKKRAAAAPVHWRHVADRAICWARSPHGDRQGVASKELLSRHARGSPDRADAPRGER
jgi:hypothetical protein